MTAWSTEALEEEWVSQKLLRLSLLLVTWSCISPAYFLFFILVSLAVFIF